MELDVEVEQMFERLAGDGAHRALTDVCKHRIQQFSKQSGPYTCGAVCRSNAQLGNIRPNNKSKAYKQERQSRRQPTLSIVHQVGY
jgi:hypothetical protein